MSIDYTFTFYFTGAVSGAFYPSYTAKSKSLNKTG
jgi:hypothetical protein